MSKSESTWNETAVVRRAVCVPAPKPLLPDQSLEWRGLFLRRDGEADDSRVVIDLLLNVGRLESDMPSRLTSIKGPSSRTRKIRFAGGPQ
jgi:hypothetical protein